MARLDADVIVPGHGEVMRDKNYLYNVRDLLESAVAQVDRQLRRIGPAEVNTVEQVIGSVDLTPFKPKFIGGNESLNKDFDRMADLLVRLVFKEAALR